METQSPDFESIKQISPYQAEYWSARDLDPLLGYNKWQNFEVAIYRAMTSCQQVDQNLPTQSNQDDTITGTSPQDTLWESKHRLQVWYSRRSFVLINTLQKRDING